MSNKRGVLGRWTTCALVTAGLALAGSGFAGAGEQPSTSAIINKLTPKQPLTRSLSVSPAETAKNNENNKFVDSLRGRTTRSLSTGDREKIAVIAKEKPSIDLEINFEYNSDQISRSAMTTVESLGKALTDPALAGNTFILAGYTDAKGGEEYNQNLSERRADAVKRYLSEKYSVAADRLVTVGYGKSHLKNPANPSAAENRRVAVTNMADKKVADK
jgi:outer membrane protein OmpA-like peptidoglycan-associated protein